MSFSSSRTWAFTQMVRGIQNAKGVFFLALTLASLSLTIPVFIANLVYGLAEPLRAVPLAPEITVFAYQNISDSMFTNLQERIGRHEHVMRIEVIPKEKALENLNKSLGLKQDKDDSANPLPDLIIVTLETNMSPEEIEKTAENIYKLKGVSMVAYDSSWLSKLDALYKALLTLGIIFVAITFFMLLCVIAASVRLAADAQKNELRLLYLFGASPSFSIRPYAWRGIFTMGLAAIFALTLSAFARQYANEALKTVGEQYGTQLTIAALPLEVNIAFVVFCALLGGLIASIITRRAIAKIEQVY